MTSFPATKPALTPIDALCVDFTEEFATGKPCIDRLMADFAFNCRLEIPVKIRLWALSVFIGLLAASGCGRSVRVTGQVSCQGKPVPGGILFSPKGEGPDNTGPAVSAQINEDGSYDLRLTTIGKHKVVVTPQNMKYPIKPGEAAFPCNLSPQEWEVTAGDNSIVIELAKRTK